MKNCLLLKGSEKKKSAKTVNTVTSSGEDFESMLVLTLSIRSASNWILDSRGSYYMCPDKNLFYTLRKYKAKMFL